MELKIKAVSPKIGREFPLPQYKTAGAAAMDLCACMEEDVTLAPGQRLGIPRGSPSLCPPRTMWPWCLCAAAWALSTGSA